MSSRRFWLLSAYRADSHARWADELVRDHGHVRWHRFELPGRHFAWRIRGNPLSWLDALDGPQPDAIVATSMVDLATLRGLHPRLAHIPVLLYFHENQFAYPRSDRQTTSVEAQMVQVYAALCADRVRFNSTYNRDTFLDGVRTLLGRMPDGVPGSVVERIEGRCAVLPVPIRPIRPAAQRDPSLIVWNHRWEYDKDPDLFAAAMIELDRRGAGFRLALLGPRGRRSVPALERLRARLGDRIEIDGCPPRPEYEAVLARAGIVVSTAKHEFQGLAVIEAVSAGCIPLVPDGLCYREQFPRAFRYAPGSTIDLADRLARWLDEGSPRPTPPAVTAWTGAALGEAWARALEALRPS